MKHKKNKGKNIFEKMVKMRKNGKILKQRNKNLGPIFKVNSFICKLFLFLITFL